jgi:hypothetical protein
VQAKNITNYRSIPSRPDYILEKLSFHLEVPHMNHLNSLIFYFLNI